MYAKRIIPCLDVNNGRVVGGTNFVNLRDAGDPVEAAKIYDAQGADELVFLDICFAQARNIILDIVSQVADSIFIPFSRRRNPFRGRFQRFVACPAQIKCPSIRQLSETLLLIQEAADKFGEPVWCVQSMRSAVRKASWTVL